MNKSKNNGSSESKKGESGKHRKQFSPESMQGKSGETQSPALKSKLQKLMEDQLKDIYWAEKALTKAIPKMIEKSTSEVLVTALEKHLRETENQVVRLEKAFDLLGKKVEGKKCEAMAGLIKEAEDIMDEAEEGVMRDAGIIAAGQKVEHYEIASYGTLKTFARTLGHDEVAEILEEILEEEKTADATLSEVAESAINVEAAAETAEKE